MLWACEQAAADSRSDIVLEVYNTLKEMGSLDIEISKIVMKIIQNKNIRFQVQTNELNNQTKYVKMTQVVYQDCLEMFAPGGPPDVPDDILSGGIETLLRVNTFYRKFVVCVMFCYVKIPYLIRNSL